MKNIKEGIAVRNRSSHHIVMPWLNNNNVNNNNNEVNSINSNNNNSTNKNITSMKILNQQLPLINQKNTKKQSIKI